MQSGKCGLTRPSMDLAVMTVPVRFVVVSYSGWVKPRERWFRIGTSRSSSSNRGSERAVSSRAASRRVVNSAETRESCSEVGT